MTKTRPLFYYSVQFSRSVMSNSLRSPWTVARQASLFIANSRSLLKLMSVESVMPSNHLILCHPFFSCLQSFQASSSFPMSRPFPSKYWSFSFNTSPFSEYSGLISLGLTGLISLQSKGLSRVSANHSSRASILCAQLSL